MKRGTIRMFKNFRLKLTIILIVFSLLLSLLIAIFDYEKLRDTVLQSQKTKIAMAEDKIIHNLSTIDKVYHLFDKQIAETMETYSIELLSKYEAQPDFNEWDFKELQAKYKMDIFIMNNENTVIHSSFPQDVGLDFGECCPGFSKLLNERREGQVFTHDGMDIQSKTGEIKKFSYMPTSDQKYIIELGVLLEDQDIFKQFNFLTTIESLLKEYETIDSIKVYNSGGNHLGIKTENFQNEKIEQPFLEIFEQVRGSGQSKELVVDEDGSRTTYRFIPYMADETRGYSTKRVVEIAYNNNEMTGILLEYKNQFLLQLVAILIGSVVLSFFIARLVARPIHLAFHDSLTGLKNRAAFEDEIQKRFERKNKKIAILMIDLDNFKSVNDYLGHGEGDRILKVAASTIDEVIGTENLAARVGGDEFLVLLDTDEINSVKKLAEKLIRAMADRLIEQLGNNEIRTSISIGVAVATEKDTFESLYEKADQALYKSKENGKNQFSLYEFV